MIMTVTLMSNCHWVPAHQAWTVQFACHRLIDTCVFDCADGGSGATHLPKMQVHNRDKVQRMCILVVIRAAIVVVHPQLHQPAFKGDHVHCTTHTHTYTADM